MPQPLCACDMKTCKTDAELFSNLCAGDGLLGLGDLWVDAPRLKYTCDSFCAWFLYVLALCQPLAMRLYIPYIYIVFELGRLTNNRG